jgi:hypothetical protein
VDAAGQWLSDNFEPGQPVKKYIKSAHTLTTPKGRREYSPTPPNVLHSLVYRLTWPVLCRVAMARSAAPSRDTIYLVPMGSFEDDRSPPLEELLRFGEAYLQMPMALLPGLHLRPSDKQPKTHLQVDFPPELRPRYGAQIMHHLLFMSDTHECGAKKRCATGRSAAARHQEIRWRWHHEHTKRKQLSTRDIHSLLRSVLPDDGATQHFLRERKSYLIA